MATLQLISANFVYQRVLRYILPQHSYTFVTAADSIEALGQLAQHSFDLIVIDVPLQAMENLMLLKRMRAHQTVRLLPILVITDSGREADYHRAFEEGASAVLPWPFSSVELRAVVHLLSSTRSGDSLPVQIPISGVQFAAYQYLRSTNSYQQAS